MRFISKLAVAALAIVSLTGCITKTEYIDRPVLYQREPLGIKPPTPLTLDEIPITLVKPQTGNVYLTLTPDAYKSMILNNRMIETYIRESHSRIEACENYYTAPIEDTEPGN